MAPQNMIRTDEAIKSFKKQLRVAGRSETTIASYTASLNKLAAVAEWLPCTKDDVMTALVVTDMKSVSRYHMLRVIRSFIKVLRDDFPEMPDPTTGLMELFRGIEEEDPRVLTEEETNLLVQAAKDSSYQDFLMVITFLDTGIRVGEMASVRASSIRLPWLWVTGKRGRRRVPILKPMADMLLAHQGDDGVIWRSSKTGGAMTTNGIQKRITALFQAAGIDDQKKNGPHTLRHSMATKYIERDGNVAILQQILGHKTLTQTNRYVTLAGRPVLAQHAEKSLALDYLPQQQTIPVPGMILASPAIVQTSTCMVSAAGPEDAPSPADSGETWSDTIATCGVWIAWNGATPTTTAAY